MMWSKDGWRSVSFHYHSTASLHHITPLRRHGRNESGDERERKGRERGRGRERERGDAEDPGGDEQPHQ